MIERRPDIDAEDEAGSAAAARVLGDAIATLERWLRATLDDPARDLSGPHAEELRVLGDDQTPLTVGMQLDSVAALIEELGAGVAATHRKAVRTGYDLHDGAIQHVLVTGLELQTLRRELEGLPAEHRQKALERLAVVHGRLLAMETDLRELAHSLERPAFAEAPLESAVREEVEAFERDTGIAVTSEIDGDFAETTRSQRIAVLRVLQGALANVRHHAGARTVRVALLSSAESLELVVEDDGRGFSVDEALADATRRGRLGLVAMGERVRLLGGELELDSRPGGPTRVVVSLQPLPARSDA